jgi:lipopolysaccharide biosynthesis protein
MITNEREIIQNDLEFLNIIGVKLKKVKNEGLDFGMWFKTLKEVDIDKYDQIGFINDSCVLFNRVGFKKVIDWVDTCQYDFCGMTDSNEFNYHLQSYFIIAKKNTFKDILDHYNKNGVIISEDPWDIIKVYELGLSKRLSDKKFKIGSYFNVGKVNHNLSIFGAHTLIPNGYPMLKKKLVFDSFRQDERGALSQANFYPKNIGYKSMMKREIKDDVSLEYLLNS